MWHDNLTHVFPMVWLHAKRIMLVRLPTVSEDSKEECSSFMEKIIGGTLLHRHLEMFKPGGEVQSKLCLFSMAVATFSLSVLNLIVIAVRLYG